MHKTSTHLILIVIIGIIIYSNTLHSPFVFDDTLYITENPGIRTLSNLLDISDIRYVTTVTFALNYSLGGYNTFGYHIFNLAIHILNAILVYWLVALTFRTPFFSSQQSAVSSQNSEHRTQSTELHVTRYTLHAKDYELRATSYIALFSALLFVSHPIQTQAITYITQRFASLATFFYLLSLVMYIKFRMQESDIRCQVSDNREQNKTLNLKPKTWYLCSLISAVLAMKTKEISFTLPFIIVLYEFSFFGRTQNPELKTQNSKLKGFLYLLPFIITLIIIPMNLSLPVQDIHKTELIVEDDMRQFKLKELSILSKYEYLLTQFRVIVTYVRLLFLPVNQNLLYDYPVYKSFFEPQVFLSFLFLLSILGIGIYLFYRSRLKKVYSSSFIVHSSHEPLAMSYERLIAFGIFWFFITLSVESSIIPIQHTIFEHRIYLPSVGAIVAFIAAIFYVFKFIDLSICRFTYSLLQVYCSAALIIVFSIGTYQRNNVWKNDINLWRDTTKKSPFNEKAHTNLCVAYLNQEFLNEAIQECLTALRLKPDYPEAHNNLGLAYYRQGRLNEAIREYLIAIRLNSDYPEVYNDLGIAYYRQGRLDEAIQKYLMAIKLKPYYEAAHNNLGLAYADKGQMDAAIKEYSIALRFNPKNIKILDNLGNIYLRMSLIDNAITYYRAALKLDPELAETHNNLGVAYRQKGLINEAIQEFQTALRIKPDLIQARQNLEALKR